MASTAPFVNAHAPAVSSSLRQVTQPQQSPTIKLNVESLIAAFGSTADLEPSLHQNNNDASATGSGAAPTSVALVAALSSSIDGCRAVADTVCAFCCNDASHNKIGRPEALVSCFQCGSSGHPTCLEFDDMRLVRRIGEYEWRCRECKKCEMCLDKGEDVGSHLFGPSPSRAYGSYVDCRTG